MNEGELLGSAKRGDHKAFKQLVELHQSLVARTVKGMLGDCPEAEDIGQEVFVRFYLALPRFRGDSSIGTYLTRIAINLSINEIKRRKRRFRLFSPKSLEDHTNVADCSNQKLIDKQTIRKALDNLDPKSRSVIVLRLIDGYSTEETASILGVPVGTVLSRLWRAQRKLRSLLFDAVENQK